MPDHGLRVIAEEIEALLEWEKAQPHTPRGVVLFRMLAKRLRARATAADATPGAADARSAEAADT